ncbi:hypothetical protein [Weissella tructae]
MPQYVLKQSGTDSYVKTDGNVLAELVPSGNEVKPTIYPDAWAAMSVVKTIDQLNSASGVENGPEYELEIWNPDNWAEV